MITSGNNVFRYVSLAVAAAYVAAGVGVVIRREQFSQFLNGFTIPFGIVLIIYGIFRGYRVFQRHF